MDGAAAALAFFPAMMAGKRLPRGKAKGQLHRDRKAWRIDFINGSEDGVDPNLDFSVRDAGDGQESIRSSPPT